MELVGVLDYPNWLIFSRNLYNKNNSPRVITYINIQLSFFCFSLYKDIYNYRDISLISFFNNTLIFFLLNIYSDLSQLALKYLKNTEANINNVIIMTGNFNIRDNLWNFNYPHHSIHRTLLFNIVDSFHLGLSEPTNYCPTRYSDNNHDLNSVIDLMLLRLGSEELDCHSIYPEWYIISDHALLTVTILIFDEYVQTKKHTIVKDSDKENNFITKLIVSIRGIDTNDISDIDSLENIVQYLAYDMERI